MKKIFSFGVYKEMIRRVFIATVIVTAIIAVFAVSKAIDVSSVAVEYGEAYEKPEGLRVAYFDIEDGALQTAVVPYAAAGLAFVAFSFVMKRKSSDFYHALPVSRLTLYVSGMCAVATAVAVMLVLPSFIGFLSGLAFGSVLIPDIILLRHCIDVFFSAMFYAGSAAVAISVTGMYLPALMLTAAIDVLPQLTYAICTDSIYDMLPFLGQGDITFDVIGKTLTFMRYYGTTALPGVVKAAVVLVAGGILFVKRKSETAEKSAPNRVLQYVYGALVGFGVSLMILRELISLCAFGESSIGLTGFILGYGLAFIAIAAFELITTKRLKNIKNVFVSAAAVVLVNTLLVLSVIGAASAVKTQRYTVSAVKIETGYYDGYSIQNIFALAGDLGSEEEFFVNSYSAAKIKSDYIITDEAVLRKVEELYDRTVRSCENGTDQLEESEKLGVTLTVKGGKKLERMLFLKASEVQQLGEFMLNDENFRSLCSLLPQKNEVNEVGACDLFGGGYLTLSEKYVKYVYGVFFDEFSSLSENEQLCVATGQYEYDKYAYSDGQPESTDADTEKAFEFYAIGRYKNEDFRLTYLINEQSMPKTYGLLKQIYEAKSQIAKQ